MSKGNWIEASAIAASGVASGIAAAGQQYGGLGLGNTAPTQPAQQTTNNSSLTQDISINVSGGSSDEIITAIQSYVRSGGVLINPDSTNGRLLV